MNDDITVTKIDGTTCGWAVDDPHWHGHQMPHGIKARRRVENAGEFYDGDYCIRHARMAVERPRAGPA